MYGLPKIKSNIKSVTSGYLEIMRYTDTNITASGQKVTANWNQTMPQHLSATMRITKNDESRTTSENLSGDSSDDIKNAARNSEGGERTPREKKSKQT